MSQRRWLGGEDAAPALRLSASRSLGTVLSYGELRDRVESFELPPTGIVKAHSVDTESVLVSVLAALHARRPVLVSDPASPPPAVHYAPPTTELVLMTSGSSGIARPIARTSASWHDSFEPFTEATGLSSLDSVSLSGPLHVSMHLYAALHALWLGAELRTDPSTASAVHCTPAALGRLLSAGSMPRRVIVAGASLPNSTRDAAHARGVQIIEYYGAAELSFVAISDKQGTLRPFPGVELELRDSEDAGRQGSVVWARSPYLAIGYAVRSGGTAPAGALLTDGAGFASVGDIAEWGANDELLVRGRGDSAVTTAGSTVLSEDVERALETLAGVAAAAVIAEPHPVLGEIIVAVIEVGTGATSAWALEEAFAGMRTASNALLAPVERPRRWLFVESLPRTASGKLAKGALRTGFDSGAIPFREFGVTHDA